MTLTQQNNNYYAKYILITLSLSGNDDLLSIVGGRIGVGLETDEISNASFKMKNASLFQASNNVGSYILLRNCNC